MKKAIACLLALSLALSACGAQVEQPAATPAPEITTEATAETSPETPAEATSSTAINGWMRWCTLEYGSWELDCDTGYYNVSRVWNDSTATNTFVMLKTDPAAAEQKKVAEVETSGWFEAMAHWDDTVELYLGENAEDGSTHTTRCTIDAATGTVEKQTLQEEFTPSWYDDAAVYCEQRDALFLQSVTRLDRATGELTEISLPGQSYMISGAVDGRWLLQRINSPAPLPDVATMDDTFMATWQNSEVEYILYDAETGEMEKLYSMPTEGENWTYLGQRDGSLYFMHSTPYGESSVMASGIDKLENGTMTQVCAIDADHVSIQPVVQNGELQWVTQEGENDMYIYDVASGQNHKVDIRQNNDNAGLLQWLAPNEQVMVSNGTYTDVAGLTRPAYALLDRAAYLAGSTDYTPITMYTGE